MKKFGKTYTFVLGLLVALGLFWRLLFLTSTPPAISNDEIDYLLLAKSVAYQGRDLSLTQPWWWLQPMQANAWTSELGFWFQLPAMIFLPSGQVTSKIMPVTISTLLIVFTYLFLAKLSGNKRLGLLAGFVVAISPWAIFIGRTGYEAPVALTLFVASFWLICVLVHSRSKHTRLIFVGWLLVFLLAFFTYHGLKITGVGLTICLCFYLAIKNRKQVRWLTIISVLAIATLGFNSWFLTYKQVRTSELLFFNWQPFVSASQKAHRLNFSPRSWSTKLLDNKYCFFLLDLLDRWARVYNPQLLFVQGELMSDFGQFYYLDLPLLLMGFYVLAKRKKFVELWFLGFAFLIAPLANVLKVNSSHGNLQNCFLIVLVAMVTVYAWEWWWQRDRRYGLTIGFLYLCSFFVWAHNYYDRFPLYSEEDYNFQDRLLSHYLYLSQQPVTVITPDPYNTYRNYIFYNNLYTRQTATLLADDLRRESLDDRHYDNITFSDQCDALAEATSGGTVIVSAQMKCPLPLSSDEQEPVTPLNIVAIKDSGTYYRIFNDRVCGDTFLANFLLIQNRQSFKLEKMDAADFCHTWLVKYAD